MVPVRFGRTAYRFITLVGIAGSAMVVMGCSSGGDRLIGVERSRAVPTTCIRQCNDLYRALVNQETKTHTTNLEICLTQPEGTRGQCEIAESLRHGAEMERLSQGLSDCQSSCARNPGGFEE